MHLWKSDEFAGDVARMPGHGEAPDDVGEHADEADAEICWHNEMRLIICLWLGVLVRD